MKKIVILVFSLVLCACNNNTSLDNLKQVMETQEHVIIDVRTEDEYLESHLVNSINIPYDEINKNIEIDKDKAIFVYCKSGSRSGIASSILENLGYEVYDLGAFSDIDLPKE